MEAKNKLRLAAAIGAILVTFALFTAIGPLGQVLSHGFDAVSPLAQARLASFARIFAVSAPALAAAVAATVASRQRARRERDRTTSPKLGRDA